MAGWAGAPVARDMPWRVVAFGFLLCVSSMFGQTHFFSLFNEQLRAEFGLSHAGLGALYSAATLMSACLLPWLGKLLDHWDARVFTATVVAGLAAALALLAAAAHPVMLFAAMFMLRMFGQGLSGHTGLTMTARLADRHRGKSLALVQLGFGAGEMIAPLVVGALLVVVGWRTVWAGAAAVELVVVMGLALWLLSGLDHHPASRAAEEDDAGAGRSWTRAEVLRDPRFWRIAPTLFAPPFFITALVFHQADLAAHENVPLRVWATGLVAYSAVGACVTLFAGQLVDQRGALFVLRLGPIPLAIAMLMPVLFDGQWVGFVYYALLGVGVGFMAPAGNALWRELYGSRHLGAILAMVHALIVLSSAVAPVAYGLMLDAEWGWTTVLGISCVYFALVFIPLLSLKKVY